MTPPNTLTVSQPPNVSPLLIVAFLSSISAGILSVAIPFQAELLSGKSSLVGLTGGLMMGCYVFAMLAGRKLLDRVHSRSIIMAGSLLLGLITTLISQCGTFSLFACGVAGYGVATSWLWPPIMGWLSGGREGDALNRVLGKFNASWSIGLIIGPLVGGWLYYKQPAFPFYAASLLHAACVFVLITIQPTPLHQTNSTSSLKEFSPDPRTARFRAMARIGMVCSYLAFGMLRNQLPLLAKGAMQIDSAKFGPIATSLSAAMTIGFVLLGRTPNWHYQARRFWLIQTLLGIFLLLPAWTPNYYWLYLTMILTGPCISFLYASHLFYGVTGGTNRPRLMAIHEILLSCGFLLGAFGGGLVGDLTQSLRTPYWFGGFAILLGVALEIIIFQFSQPIAENKDRSTP